MPKLRDQLASFTKAMGKAIQAGPDAFVTREVKAKRLSVCEGCPRKEMVLGQPRCGACGCFCKAKAALATETCPEGRWDA